jgi:hypothetical protein
LSLSAPGDGADQHLEWTGEARREQLFDDAEAREGQTWPVRCTHDDVAFFGWSELASTEKRN